MKYRLSTSALAVILVFSAGFVFPLIFSITDRLLRGLFSAFEPAVLTAASFSWLLLLYYYGIKFSLDYVRRQFEISERQKLFNYSNIGFTAMSLIFYTSLISASVLSNLLWGSFYLYTIGLFYYLSSKMLPRVSE